MRSSGTDYKNKGIEYSEKKRIKKHPNMVTVNIKCHRLTTKAKINVGSIIASKYF